MIVSGMYALSQKESFATFNRNQWEISIANLLNGLPDDRRIVVPTPACYELMCKSKEWKDYILESQKSKSGIFKFALQPISPSILLKAAEFTLDTCVVKVTGDQGKMLTLDPMIAAYSLIYKYYIVTENQYDFPEPYFSATRCEAMILKNKEGKNYRRMLYLLKPQSLE